MQSGCRLAVTLAIGVVTASAPASLFAQAVQRALYVSVLDAKGAPIPDLGPADFVVREDNVTREILQVAPAREPMSIALLVDTSQAASQYIRDYRQALPHFVDAVTGEAAGARNLVSLIAIGERPTVLTDYTSNPAELKKGIDRVFSMPASGTYLLQGIIEVCQGLKKREATRAVIVAVTTEGPELSDRPYQSVLEPLRASGAAFHVLALGAPVNHSQDRQIVLSRGTDETGGRYDNVLASSALDMKMQQVAAELTNQYRVTYARPQTLIPPERIKVESTRAKATTRGIPVNEPGPAPRERR